MDREKILKFYNVSHSSPEQVVLKVSYCDQLMSGVCVLHVVTWCHQFALYDTPIPHDHFFTKLKRGISKVDFSEMAKTFRPTLSVEKCGCQCVLLITANEIYGSFLCSW